jgi:hypothetical protein
MELTEIVETAKRQMTVITGLPADTVARLDPAEDGWAVAIDMLEHRAIPRTHDLIAAFEVTLDNGGRILRWKRTGRFQRGQAREEP